MAGAAPGGFCGAHASIHLLYKAAGPSPLLPRTGACSCLTCARAMPAHDLSPCISGPLSRSLVTA